MYINWQCLHDEEYRREVIDVLMRTHAEMIMRYCTTWLSEGLAEEVTQSVFVTAWEKLPKYRPVASLDKWLLGIARHKCQRAYRDRARRRAIDRAFMEDIRREAHAATPPNPEHMMTQETPDSWLHDSLSKLNDTDRMLLNLRYWKGLSVPDIADIMGKSTQAVQKRLERAKHHLREMMRNATR